MSNRKAQAMENALALAGRVRLAVAADRSSLLGIAGEVKAPSYAGAYSGYWEHPTCSDCMG
jgi:hypothetical protein